MNGIKEDPEEILKKLIDEIRKFDFFIGIWNNTVAFLRDQADYVNKVSELNQSVFKFTQEPCCVIYFLTNMVKIKKILDFIILNKKFLLGLKKFSYPEFN